MFPLYQSLWTFCFYLNANGYDNTNYASKLESTDNAPNATGLISLVNQYFVWTPGYGWGLNGLAEPLSDTPVSSILPPVYSKVYIGHYATIDGSKFDLGGSKLTSIADPVNAQDAVSKKYADNAISSLSTSTTTDIATCLSSAKTYTDTSVNTQKARIDAILEGSSVNLDTLKEIVDYAKALDATEASNLTSAVSALNTSLNTEISRAQTSEAVIQSNIIKSTHLIPQPTIYADCDTPLPQPSSIISNAYDGWYYTNVSSGKKINWYVPFPTGLTFQEIKGIYAKLNILSNESNPFFVVYTQKKSSGNAGSWYNAKKVFDISSIAPSVGKTLIGALNSSFDSVADGISTNYQLELSPSPFSVGTILPTDQILAISIQSNSSASVGKVKFILQSLSIALSSGIVEYKFTNSEVQQIADEASLLSEVNARTTAVADVNSKLSLEASRADSAEKLIDNKVNDLKSIAIVSTGKTNQSIDGALNLGDVQCNNINVFYGLDMKTKTIKNIADGVNPADACSFKQVSDEIARAQASEASLLEQVNSLQSQLTVQSGYITALYEYSFGTTPNIAPTR